MNVNPLGLKLKVVAVVSKDKGRLINSIHVGYFSPILPPDWYAEIEPLSLDSVFHVVDPETDKGVTKDKVLH